ncbi:hypothetical protein ILUMI_09517 [Ignelater luminosus]|uniref:Peptidase S1 domain-containing protein n=1 Tax=Ignelater luminosus TaxID=2038154 RepID=A0A8K0D432_IGNLU|nr:hypothetical protein ILUMI_09517 [Ignelater luminosus]
MSLGSSSQVLRAHERIIGGHPVNIQDYKYQVAVEVTLVGPFCGGCIISPKYVLTAGYCGDAIAVHPDYTSNSDSSNNDIAVLTLIFTLTVGPTIGPIALPNINEEVSTGTSAVVSGWGALTEGGPSSDQLQAVTVYIVDRNKCNVTYGGIITDRMICAGVPEGGKGPCQGDSGGPLVAAGKLVGIVSWENVCGRPGYPSVLPILLQLLYVHSLQAKPAYEVRNTERFSVALNNK